MLLAVVVIGVVNVADDAAADIDNKRDDCVAGELKSFHVNAAAVE